MSEGTSVWCLKVALIIAYVLVASPQLSSTTVNNETSALGTLLSPSRWKRQSCGVIQHTCKNGGCIDSDRACDGVVDCTDGSDETAETCLNSVICPSYAYQCAYGGCVDSDARCNKKQECADGSDEKGCQDSAGVANTCRITEFKCKNGHCVDNTLVCDGATDCSDSSDETRENCGSLTCPKYSFQCSYGACIDGDGRCDGRPQCADASDERASLCNKPTTKRPSQPAPTVTECKLPPYPKNGKYNVGGCRTANCPGPGAVLAKTVILTYECNSGFNIRGNSFVFCEAGVWSEQPICVSVMCNRVVDPSLDAKCVFQNKDVPCNQQMAPGTEVFLHCKMYYTLPSAPGYSKITCQSNGRWDKEPYFKCTPECGKRNPEGVPFITGGIQSKRGEYPWHVGVYQGEGDDMEQICGGSLISPNIIVTAAHCFYDESREQRHDISQYKVAVGKHLRDWNEKTKHVQIGKIRDIVLEELYRGSSLNYANDIAVVVLEVAFEMTVAVRVVCIDWQRKYDERNVLSEGNVGVVVGWGITNGMIPSEELLTVHLPFRSFSHCYKEVPETFRPFLTKDKFCAGHRNGSSVCPGDSGGGLAFMQQDASGSTWYLRGIVSVGVPKGIERCFPQQYSAFTKVSDYYDFLNRYM